MYVAYFIQRSCSYPSLSSPLVVQQPYSKKPEMTDDESDGPSEVVTLTDANFQSEIMDSEADALVEFYAPW